MTAGAIGGTASRMGGGSFANGAQTSAFQYLFNEVRQLNPFKVIGEEFPKWWTGRETDDLRNGIEAFIDILSVPLRVVRAATDYHTILQAGAAGYNGAYGDAAVLSSSLLIGHGTTTFLKKIDFSNEIVRNAASLGNSKIAEESARQDCFSCVER